MFNKLGVFSFLLGSISSAMFFEGAFAEDWPNFRGPQFNSVVENQDIPVEFGGEERKNVTWKISIPGRSLAGAIVVGDQVIVTTSTGMDFRRSRILSYSALDGRKLWEQEIVARGRTYCHPTSSNSAPTPCTDGKRIYATFSSNDVVCVDLQGELVWYRSLNTDFPKAGNDVGMGASPVVVDGVVIVQVECQGDSFDAGLNADTGEILWKLDRAPYGNWTSPLVLPIPEEIDLGLEGDQASLSGGKSVVLMHSQEDVVCVAPRTGNVIWRIPMTNATIPSLVVADATLLVPSSGITAFSLSNPLLAPEKIWSSNRLNPNACSPLIHEGKIYTVNRTIVACGDLKTGQAKWQVRAAEGYVWSSPIIVNDKLYLFAQDGTCSVIKLGDNKGTKIASNSLGDEVYGSPAISGNAMYVRSVGGLWKISE